LPPSIPAGTEHTSPLGSFESAADEIAGNRKVEVRKKRGSTTEADELSRRIAKNKTRLAEEQSDKERDAIEKQLAGDIQRYEDIEGMPVWPVDVGVSRKYSLRNVIVSLPIASFFATEHEPFKAIGVWVESLTKLVAG